MFAKKKKAFWTQKTHLLRKDEYICSVCHRTADKPYNVCPGCRTVMQENRYDPNWVDEAELLDEFFDE